MSSTRGNTKGLLRGQDWETLPANEGPINWSFDAPEGLIQGPIGMESFSGQSMMLTLDPGQTALLIQESKLRAIYLDGIHQLTVGHGYNQISPTASLLCINTAHRLQLRWKKRNPVRWNSGEKDGLIGHCDLSISDPVVFFESTLQHSDCKTDDYVQAAIDANVRTALAGMVGCNPLGSWNTTASELLSRLTCLSAQTLTEELAGQGLTCHQLNLYSDASSMEVDSETQSSFAPVHY